MKTNYLARQGDLLIKQINVFPKEITKRKTTIILYGEVTGHKHQLTDGDIFDGKDGLIYLLLSEAAKIVHEEHKPIVLKKGKYAVIRQREYQNKDMVRLVVD